MIVMVVLQNCCDLPKVAPGSYNETRVTSSHDGNQFVNIKVEDVVDTQEDEEEEDPLLIEFPVMKSENEVCKNIIRHISYKMVFSFSFRLSLST